MTTRASRDNALAISTSCRCATDKRETGARGPISMPRPCSRFPAALIEPWTVDEETTTSWLPVQVDVLRDIEVRHQAQLLVDHRDTRRLGLRRRREPDLAAVMDQLPAVGSIDAGSDLDECGLASAVLADEGMHLTWSEDQIDAVHRLDDPEALADPPQLE